MGHLRLAGAAAYWFAPLSGMAPLGEGRTPYALPIAGLPLGVHIARRIAESVDGPAKFGIDDPDLARSADLVSAIKAFGEVLSAGEPGRSAGFPTTGGGWLPLEQPWDLLAVQEEILYTISPGISDDAYIEDGAEIEGNVRIEAGARIYSGARIKGPVYIGEDASIGNNAFVRGASSLAAGSVVGFGAEVKNSLLAERFGAGSMTHIADTLADQDCFLGGLVRLSNYRLDGHEVEYMTDGHRLSTGRRQFGAVLGAGVSLGTGCIVYPGRQIGAGCRIAPRVNVVKNLPARQFVTLEQSVMIIPLAAGYSER